MATITGDKPITIKMDLTAEQQRAYEILCYHFLHTKCFKFPENDGSTCHDCGAPVCSHEAMMDVVKGSMEAIRILEEFPMFAKQRFQYRQDEISRNGLAYPLAFFVWNGFDLHTLKRIHKLYPNALSQEFQEWSYSNLWEYACVDHEDSTDGEDPTFEHETLLWMATSMEDTKDTSEALLRYMDQFLCDTGLEFGGAEFEGDAKSILEALLSKNPQFTTDQMGPLSKTPQFATDQMGPIKLLDVLVYLGCDPELILKTIHRLPDHCRVLNIGYDLSERVLGSLGNGWALHGNESGWVEGLKKYVLPELVGLEFNGFCFVDDDAQKAHNKFMRAIGDCTKLRKLSVHVPIEMVRYVDIESLQTVLWLSQKMSKSAKVTLQLYHGLGGNLDWLEHTAWWDENCDLDDPQWWSTTMATIENECIRYISNNMSIPVQQIILKELEGPHYEAVLELCSFASALTVEKTDLGSSIDFSRRLCEMWNRNCRCHPPPHPLGVLASVCNRSGLFIRKAIVRNNPLHGIHLKKVRLFHGGESRNGADITSSLTSILKSGTIKELLFNTYGGQKLDISKFCDAAKNSTQLERLEVKGVDFCGKPHCFTRSLFLMDSLLEMVEKSPSRKLSFLLVACERYYHFSNQDGTGLFETAGDQMLMRSLRQTRIQYLLILNKFGFGKLRESNASVETVVKHLIRVRSANPSTLLKVSPWFFANKDVSFYLALITSILYGFLREAPHLWCKGLRHDARNSTTRRPKRRASRAASVRSSRPRLQK